MASHDLRRASLNQKQIIKDIDRIALVDAEVKAAISNYGYPQPRIRPQGFETFLATMVGQQISTAASAAIIRRIRGLLPRMEATELLRLPPGSLQEAGLSGRKVEYAQGLAEAIVNGDLNPDALPDLDDRQAIEAITALRGFGVWSAEIYLMFSLQRRDIFPADDLALQVALQGLKGLEQRPTAKQARTLIAHWSPWSSAGSLFLWHYYKINRV
jgi:DNA-3-methyladenine glycosylase II